jgi:hypothetical protein
MITLSGIRGKVGSLDGPRKRSKPPTDCAEAVKRANLPSSWRTSGVVGLSHLA